MAAVAEHDTEQLITDMHGRRQAFYERLKTFEHFGKGWTRRNEETLHQAIELCRGGRWLKKTKKNRCLSVAREKRWSNRVAVTAKAERNTTGQQAAS